ncbi:hypothetical protein KL929_003229 [Ogataea haglerorum]|uniref:uncharacterized protein n=1 Tax=Ogataea haglerorum TaxID=1937702 RepID=UPI001C8A1B3E|nr:uncharacterized protein KL911_003235 [Ogataea haglerorum]KAG7695646.1 hypothetical protein KL915_003036 [Ogataea haglerorum]KAG7695975.1 hypothetical protein KL951_003500 [Ogataea haglerorum]KAG7705601.1 hypothetical protein KL914_003439 [Ogataea haglerorum]KAG7707382.1 hypothetical protein KL950_003042 [Ogataea haglerorum]KAG7743400.1 hypothetical protein KL932_002141 [Ogataea haglerorum]
MAPHTYRLAGEKRGGHCAVLRLSDQQAAGLASACDGLKVVPARVRDGGVRRAKRQHGRASGTDQEAADCAQLAGRTGQTYKPAEKTAGRGKRYSPVPADVQRVFPAVQGAGAGDEQREAGACGCSEQRAAEPERTAEQGVRRA